MRLSLRLLATVCCLGAGCENSSQLVVGVLTNLSVRGALDEVTLSATRNGGVQVLSEDWSISPSEGTNFVLPGSFTVYSPAGGTPTIELTVTGYLASVAQVERIADVELVSQQQMFMRMTIVDTCNAMAVPIGVASCPNGQSCVEGLCREQTVDNKTLLRNSAKRYAEVECDSGVGYIDSGTCATGTCQVIPPLARTCPTGEFCLEGTCYDRDTAAARVLAFGETCDAGQGDTCVTGNLCAAPGLSPNQGDQRCRQTCTQNSDCTNELPGATSDVKPTVASCDTTVGVCTFACNPSLNIGCAAGSRCDIVYPNGNSVGVDCVNATFTPSETKNLPTGSACTDSRDCVEGATCFPSTSGSICRALCSPGTSTDCGTGLSCFAISPPGMTSAPSELYGTCCPQNGC